VNNSLKHTRYTAVDSVYVLFILLGVVLCYFYQSDLAANERFQGEQCPKHITFFFYGSTTFATNYEHLRVILSCCTKFYVAMN